MSALAIFICHDCKIATKSVNDKLIPYDYSLSAFQTFNEIHKNHDTACESDAHGQISPEDYDFKEKQFIIKNEWGE